MEKGSDYIAKLASLIFGFLLQDVLGFPSFDNWSRTCDSGMLQICRSSALYTTCFSDIQVGLHVPFVWNVCQNPLWTSKTLIPVATNLSPTVSSPKDRANGTEGWWFLLPRVLRYCHRSTPQCRQRLWKCDLNGPARLWLMVDDYDAINRLKMAPICNYYIYIRMIIKGSLDEKLPSYEVLKMLKE